VLVLESDPLLLRTFRRHLSHYDVIQIGSPEEIASLVEQHRPVALIVNAQETDPANWRVPSDLPIIHTTLTGNLHAAQALGVQNYLIKPILRESLIEAIAGLGTAVRDVLIVDDDPELVELIARMLQSAGGAYRPIKTFGGADALVRLREEKVDLVLLDLFMPGVDGMRVLQEMKRDPGLAEIPVIIVSAQQPEIADTERGLFVRLERAERGSITETLNCLQALIETLPLRGLPTIAHAPA
jgi:CheY-like chemotaxis protein